MITEGKSWKSPLFKSRRMKEIEGPKVEISTVEINAVVFIALVHLLCSRTFYTGTYDSYIPEIEKSWKEGRYLSLLKRTYTYMRVYV